MQHYQRPRRQPEFIRWVLARYEREGLTREDFFQRTGVTRRTVERWADETRPLTEENAVRILYHLYVDNHLDHITEALDLAGLIEMGRDSIESVVKKLLNADAKKPHFLDEMAKADGANATNRMPQPFWPHFPAFYVPTAVAWQAKVTLLTLLDFRHPLHQVIVLHGSAGVGKTTTAACLLRDEQLAGYFRDGRLFIPLGNDEHRAQAPRRACEQAGLPVNLGDTRDQLERAFRDWITQDHRLALLILDDPLDAEDLSFFLDVGPQVRILITCRDRQPATWAVESRWGDGSDLVLWQPVSGLTESEGLSLVRHWQPEVLSPEEDRAMHHVGEMLHWHPLAMRVSVTRARAASWQAWETEVIDGHLDPDDFQVLTALVQTMWDRLPASDQEALSELRRAFHETSSFGPGIAATVWNEKVEQAAKCMSRLEGAGVIEKIAQEPWPWQGLIQAAYGGQDRYRLSPLVRLIRREAEQPRWYDRSGWQGLLWRLRIASRSRGLMAHLQAAESSSWLRELALALDLVRHESKWDRPDLEKRLRDLWEVRGLFPPAEVWIDFKGLQWFHGSPRIFLAMFGTVAVVAGILWAVAVKASTWVPLIFWPAIALIAFCVLPLSIVIARQRAYWTLLLGLYDPEMPEAASIRAYRKQRGLSDPFSGE